MTKVNICDKCDKQTKEFFVLNIKKKSYELCPNCTDNIIKSIENKVKKSNNVLDRLKDSLENLNG